MSPHVLILFHSLLLLSVGIVFALIEMTVTCSVARRINNYGIVDVVWSAGFSVIALWYVLFSFPVTGPVKGDHLFLDWLDLSWWTRALPLTGMILLWSLRLASHLAVRVRAHHLVEDVRYARLREEWGPRTHQRMFWLFQLQGIFQVILSLPFALALTGWHPDPERAKALFWEVDPPILWVFGFWEYAGAGLWLAGWLGESLADLQLARFRADPANRGQVCQAGLWNYSRHPNYFFEWVIWVGFAVFALGVPFGWMGLISPLLMGHFLVNITGIPMTEELSVKSKGDAYRKYQRTTSAFIPWFKRIA